MLLVIETGAPQIRDQPVYAYRLMADGKLQEAYRLAGGAQAPPFLQCLLGASEAAPQEWQEQALNCPLEDIATPVHALYLAVLALRRGDPHEDYLAKCDELMVDTGYSPEESPLTFIKKIIADQSIANQSIIGRRITRTRSHGLADWLYRRPS